MTQPARSGRDDGPVPAFVTIGVGVPVLIAATILVDVADWSAVPSALVIAGLVAVCCLFAEMGTALLLGVVTWFFVDGFVEDTGGTLHVHPGELTLFAACVALPALVALTGVLLRRLRSVRP